MASASGGATSQVICSEKSLQVMAIFPMESEWSTCFMNGLRSRIGERINQDAEISITLIIEMKRLLCLEFQWH